METLTDSTGVIQHAIFSIPNRRTGYTTDDNARALIAAIKEFERTGSRPVLRLVSTYLSFMHYAQNASGHFHNFMSYDQVWLDNQGSEDCLGRVLWGCGYALSTKLHPNVKKVAKEIFDRALRWTQMSGSLRARGYITLGCCLYLKSEPDNSTIRQSVESVCNSLCDDYERYATNGWEWFEGFLTYSNGIIPTALFNAYQLTGIERFRKVGEDCLAFLTQTCIIDNVLQPIGCSGWYFRGGERAYYDQQPVDPMAHTMSYLAAYEATSDKSYLKLAKVSFDWFFGNNSVGEALYDPVTGGCYDALLPNGTNLNQGSESTVCCLLAQLYAQPYVHLFESL